MILRALLLCLLLSSCASQKASNIQVIWHDGQCLWIAEGLSAEQAKNVSKDWEFKDCEVRVETELGEGPQGTGDTEQVETPEKPPGPY